VPRPAWTDRQVGSLGFAGFKEGQTPLAAALSFFDEEPARFRGLLVDAVIAR